MNIKSYSITVKQYFTNKNSYALKNYRLKNRSRSSDDNPEILFEIKYYDYYYVGDTIQSSTAINIDKLLNRITTLENRIQQLENA